MTILNAVEQIDAAERIAFVTDMSTVVSGMFAAKGSNPIADHLNLLEGVITGDLSGNASK